MLTDADGCCRMLTYAAACALALASGGMGLLYVC
jgi:hypothetical protein